MLMKTRLPIIAAAIGLLILSPAGAQEAAKPLKALLVIGGCCHDYAAQKEILKAGIEARLNIRIDVDHSTAQNTKPEFKSYAKDDWAAGYDVIIHDECAADVKDPALVNRVLAPHRDGLPGVNLHCAMHSFRVAPDVNAAQETGTEGAAWFEYLGIQSSGHGPRQPVEIRYTADASPITRGLANWTTGDEELYNNIRLFPGITELAKGQQGSQETVVIWKQEYGPEKAKVFSTTLGHFNETVADDRYLDLVSRGLLWACGKLDADGRPAEGYWIRKP